MRASGVAAELHAAVMERSSCPFVSACGVAHGCGVCGFLFFYFYFLNDLFYFTTSWLQAAAAAAVAAAVAAAEVIFHQKLTKR